MSLQNNLIAIIAWLHSKTVGWWYVIDCNILVLKRKITWNCKKKQMQETAIYLICLWFIVMLFCSVISLSSVKVPSLAYNISENITKSPVHWIKSQPSYLIAFIYAIHLLRIATLHSSLNVFHLSLFLINAGFGKEGSYGGGSIWSHGSLESMKFFSFLFPNWIMFSCFSLFLLSCLFAYFLCLFSTSTPPITYFLIAIEYESSRKNMTRSHDILLLHFWKINLVLSFSGDGNLGVIKIWNAYKWIILQFWSFCCSISLTLFASHSLKGEWRSKHEFNASFRWFCAHLMWHTTLESRFTIF